MRFSENHVETSWLTPEREKTTDVVGTRSGTVRATVPVGPQNRLGCNPPTAADGSDLTSRLHGLPLSAKKLLTLWGLDRARFERPCPLDRKTASAAIPRRQPRLLW